MNRQQQKSSRYVPDVSGFLKPLGIHKSLDDILFSAPLELDTVFYGNNDFKKKETPKLPYSLTVKAENQYRLCFYRGGKKIADHPIVPVSSALGRYYSRTGKLVRNIPLTVEKENDLYHIRITGTEQTLAGLRFTADTNDDQHVQIELIRYFKI